MTCQEAFPNCNYCFIFSGTSDGSELYSTPIYKSLDDRTVKNYWSCSACDEGYMLDFFGQTCSKIEVTIDTQAIEC